MWDKEALKEANRLFRRAEMHSQQAMERRIAVIKLNRQPRGIFRRTVQDVISTVTGGRIPPSPATHLTTEADLEGRYALQDFWSAMEILHGDNSLDRREI